MFYRRWLLVAALCLLMALVLAAYLYPVFCRARSYSGPRRPVWARHASTVPYRALPAAISRSAAHARRAMAAGDASIRSTRE